MSDWVFPSSVGAPSAEPGPEAFFLALKYAKLRGSGSDMRHTFASWLIANGESLVYVKRAARAPLHQITVDTYGHLIPGETGRRSMPLTTRLERYPPYQQRKLPWQKKSNSGHSITRTSQQ
jgi:integrase